MLRTSLQPKKVQLSKDQLKKINNGMYLAILNYNDEALAKKIAQGADVNASDILDNDGEILSPPLVMAITHCNRPAIKMLLEQGASVNSTTQNGKGAFGNAIASTNDFTIIEKMVTYGADVNYYHGCSALMSVITMLPSFAVIQYSNWSTPNIGKQLLDWFEQRGAFKTSDPEIGIPFPEQKSELRALYFAPLENISLLLNKGAQAWIPSDSDLTIFELLESPVKHIRHFMGDNIKFLSSNDNNILTFELELENRNDSAPRVKVIVDFDLRKIKEKINIHIKHNPQYHGIDLKALSNGLNGKISETIQEKNVETTIQLGMKLQSVEQTFQFENLKIQQRLNGIEQYVCPYKNEIEILEKHPLTEKYFDLVSRNLTPVLEAWRALASGKITRDSTTPLDMASSALSFIGDHVPAPYNIIVNLFSKGFKLASDRNEKQRFENINHILPMDRTLATFSRETSYLAICSILKRFSGLEKDFYALQLKDVEDLAKKSFAVIIHTINNINDLKIDPKLPATKRTEILVEKVLLIVQKPNDCIEKCIQDKANKLPFLSEKTPGFLNATYNNLQNGNSSAKNGHIIPTTHQVIPFPLTGNGTHVGHQQANVSHQNVTNAPIISPTPYYEGNLYPPFQNNSSPKTPMTFNYDQQRQATPPINPYYDVEPSAPALYTGKEASTQKKKSTAAMTSIFK